MSDSNSNAAIAQNGLLPVVSRPIELPDGEMDTEYKCVGCGSWELDVTTEGLCMACWYNEQEDE